MALASTSWLSNFSHGILLSLRSRQWLETDQTFCLTELCLWVLPSAFDLSCQSQRGAEDSVVTCHASVRLKLLVSQFLYFCDTLRVRAAVFLCRMLYCAGRTQYIYGPPVLFLPPRVSDAPVVTRYYLSVSGFVLLSCGSVSWMLFFIPVTIMDSKQRCHFWVPAKFYAYATTHQRLLSSLASSRSGRM